MTEAHYHKHIYKVPKTCHLIYYILNLFSNAIVVSTFQTH